MSEQVKEVAKESKTFTAIGGFDMVPVLNGHVLAEVFDIQYQETFYSMDSGEAFDTDKFSPISGIMRAYVFNSSPIKSHMNRNGEDEFIVFFKNDEGVSIRFEGFRFIERKGGFNTDNLVDEESFLFACDELVFDDKTPYGYLGEKHKSTFGYKEKVVESA
ncbi:hypothetical protein ACQVWE_14115 [Bacillus cereus]|uniref:hypothetical protein n=1 Tax=Bacillus cereus TaxID=1396 RepID=UPI003D65E4C2